MRPRIGRSPRRSQDRSRQSLRRQDRAGWAEVETAGATGDPGARMGAERSVEIHIARLVECPGQSSSEIDRALQRSWICRIGTDIARTQVARREQRVPPEISSTISQWDTAPFRAAPNSSRDRDDGAGMAKIIHGQFELAEMAFGAANTAAETGNSLVRGGSTSPAPERMTVMSRRSASLRPASMAACRGRR